MPEFILISIVVVIAFYVLLVKDAPSGYEDEKGFHYGREIDPADGEDE